jgi:hypothetical protein
MARRTQQGNAPGLPTQADGDLHSIKRQTLADNVYVQLKNSIMRGGLRDGTELKQGELAAQLGVSRVPVREALRGRRPERGRERRPHLTCSS